MCKAPLTELTVRLLIRAPRDLPDARDSSAGEGSSPSKLRNALARHVTRKAGSRCAYPDRIRVLVTGEDRSVLLSRVGVVRESYARRHPNGRPGRGGRDTSLY